MPYHYLLRIVEDGGQGTCLTLVFTFMLVSVQGRNLQTVADAIETENCEFIQQFDPARWDRPLDEAAPMIEALRIHVARHPAEEVLEAIP